MIPASADPTTLADSRPQSPEAAEAVYHVREWGAGYFFVNDEGHAAVRPEAAQKLAIDIYDVVQELRSSGAPLPLLIRFNDLLHTRVARLNESFRQAIQRTAYRSRYEGVFPVKVNQLREVVEEILEAGASYRYGLECGSKAELAATLPYVASNEMLLICNGAKDEPMMRLMLAAQKLGKNVLPVLERQDEIRMLSRLAREADVDARFGVRVRLATAGAGLWSESGGEHSKFGLSLAELTALVERLRAEGRAHQLRLLHFHLGSQIADLSNVREAVEEGGRLYAELYRRGIWLHYLDIGGGLGISYEAGNPDAPGSINYGLDDYTHAVISALKEVCDREGVPHPIVVSESGRAVAAFHSVLIVEAIDVRRQAVEELPAAGVDAEATRRMHALEQAAADAADAEALAALRRASAALHQSALAQFRKGALTLEEKAAFDLRHRAFLQALRAQAEALALEELPPDLADLPLHEPDHYLCNFSVFRSLSDYWAIGQRFPIMPIHRLLEAPARRGKLVDLTCDSDGQVTDYISRTGHKHFLELHPLDPREPYFLGIFLTGAYQDIMGDMHNLFGRVTEAHVYADAEEPQNFYVETILPGALIEEQLALVQYFPNDLERRMGKMIQAGVRAGVLRPKEGVAMLEQYRRVFREYTYMNTSRTEE